MMLDLKKTRSNLDEDWAKRSLAAVWHPCTQMKQHEFSPLVAISHGKGSWLYDTEGRAFLDCISSWWTNLFGHSNSKINQAIHAQLEKIEHVMLAGFTHQPVIELSERLIELTNQNLGHAFYASDGASAIEIAMKMSHHYWKISGQEKKNGFVCLKNSYHGETMGALAVTDIPLFKEAYGSLLQETWVVMSPDARQAKDGQSPEDVAQQAAQELELLLQKEHRHIAAVLIEPLVQCAGRMGMHSATYLKLVKKLCTQYEVHLIADEIAVGCGRTGRFFACEHAGIWPDFLTLSKGISGGYLPLSLCLSTNAIYSAFYSENVGQAFLHSHSYTGNPLACSAALAALTIFSDEQILEKNLASANNIASLFSWTKEDQRIEFSRQQGMIYAFDIKKSALHHIPEFARNLFQEGLKQQVLIRPIRNTIYVMPPYSMSYEEHKIMSLGIQRSLDLVSSMN